MVMSDFAFGDGCRPAGGRSLVLLTGLLTCLGVLGCQQDERRDQARGLIRQLEAMHVETSLSERATQVSALANLALTDSGLEQAKQACLVAHREALRGELLHAEARAALATQQDPNAVSPDDADAIRQLLDGSQAAIAKAKAALPACRDQERALIKEFR